MLAARVSRKFPSQEGLTRSRREEITEDGHAEHSPKCAMFIPMIKGDAYIPPMGITEYENFLTLTAPLELLWSPAALLK